MGPTLFRYIFKDLLKVFLLAAIVIAGIMSFGGLLRPLSERGLDASQVVRMLGWLLPAMATYSLPVAALFATTFVYGRLSADNESTAMRAAGVPTGLLGICFPAAVLGISACAVSLGLLCFVVPAANLQVERVVYSNLARLASNEINRSKRLAFSGGGGGITLTADRAAIVDRSTLGSDVVLPDDVQIVQLENVYVFRYDRVGAVKDQYEVPGEIYTARRATAFIQPPGYLAEGKVFETGLRDDRFLLTVLLEDGLKFPRLFQGQAEAPLVAAIGASQIGPLALGSPVRENTKFLDIRELHRLYGNPELSREIGEYVNGLVERQQQTMFLTRLRGEAAEEVARLETDEGEVTLMTREAISLVGDDQLNLTVDENGLIHFTQMRDGERLEVIAPRAVVSAEPIRTSDGPRLRAVFTFADASVSITPPGGEPEVTEGRGIERPVVMDFPEYLVEAEDVSATTLFETATSDQDEAVRLQARLFRQQNAVLAEIHARMSFAFACLVLPVVGAAMGLLFRSGNFLTAFAATVVPAMLSIVLISVGQGVSEDVPHRTGLNWYNPLVLGLPILWSGNVVVLLAAILLLVRLRRAP